MVIAESVSQLLHHQDCLLQLCKDLELVINLEESDLKPTSKAQYLRMLIDTFQDRVCLADSRYQVPMVGRPVSSLHISTSEHVAADLEPHDYSGAVCFKRKGQDGFPTVAAEIILVVVDGPATSVPVSKVCKDSLKWWLQEGRGASGFPLQVPLPSFLYTDMS